MGTDAYGGWAEQVQSALDVSSELPVPVQGRVVLHPSLRWALLPESFVPAPLPYTAAMLISIPPQRAPAGPLPRHVSDALQPWALAAIREHVTAHATRDIWCFRHRPPERLGSSTDAWIDDAPPPPEYLVFGPGAFKRIPHADGVGSWCACELIFEWDANGALTLFDWSHGFRTWWDTEELQAMLQVGTFQELLSHVFGGCILKATTPRQHRMGVNLRSYQPRAREIAADLGEMVAGGHYKVRPIAWIDDELETWCDMWPTAYLPSWSAPTGGTDKPGKPHEKRRLADGSAPRDIYERNQPSGAPSGPLAVDFNSLSGPMRPQHHDVCPVRYAPIARAIILNDSNIIRDP